MKFLVLQIKALYSKQVPTKLIVQGFILPLCFCFQLFMIDRIREGVLVVEGAADDIEDDLSGDEKADNEVSYLVDNLHSTDC